MKVVDHMKHKLFAAPTCFTDGRCYSPAGARQQT